MGVRPFPLTKFSRLDKVESDIRVPGVLHRFSKLLVLTTFLLILAGGLVTSTGSGLSVPDWPLAYGKFFPPMIGGIRFEHTHRLIAAVVAILTFVEMIWILRVERRRWLRWVGVAAFATVVAQALLGGLTVIYLLPTAVSVLHACLAQTFLSVVVAMALFTSDSWHETACVESEQARSFQRLATITSLLIYAQLVLGALVRHTKGNGVGLHVLVGVLVLVLALRVAFRASQEFALEASILRPALLLGLAIVFQFFLGFGAFVMKVALRDTISETSWGPVFFATAHQSLGAVVLATSVFLTLRSYRMIREKVNASP